MAEVQWIKLTTSIFDNRKIKHLRKLPDGDSIVLIWVMLLTLAGKCNAGGRIYLTERIPYDSKMLADELDFEENTVKLALEALQRFDMIEFDGAFLLISGWEEHQNIDGMDKIRESKRLAQARWREKQRNKSTVDSTVDSTETESDNAEEEEEKNKNKIKNKIKNERMNEEDQSFDHSKNVENYVENDVENSEREKVVTRFGELFQGFVMLSDAQMDDLLDKLSLEEFEKYCAVVADNERRGKHYRRKTHYQAILEMALNDRKTG